MLRADSRSLQPRCAAQPVIRRLSGDRVLVLEDGQRTGDVASTSADHAVTIDPLTAERIEVVCGTAGLFCGSNALGGVIDVIREEVPRTVPERLTGRVSAQADSMNHVLGDFLSPRRSDEVARAAAATSGGCRLDR